MMDDYRHLVYDALMDAKDIPFNVIEKYFETKDDNDDDTILELKYKAMQITPTVIEKTMTPYQLYASGSPLWTRDLTAEEADAVLKHTVGTCTLTEDEFNERYQKALNGELTKKPFHLVMGW